MTLAVILLAYSLVSLAAAVALICRSPVSSSGYSRFAAWCATLLFLLSHLMLLFLSIRHLFRPVGYTYFIGCLLLVISSRWLNGRVLFGQTHWRHYAVTAGIFAAAFALDWLI
ncbi:hypothetical protein [Paenibacillus chibensis]|uniref:hypothetical protein n=1 Tax=Paenibacillus chibensis TaxID=59846 RepID=UPI000FD92573|nr:hypothetical protein [Paenibacillus chibensis]MEC0370975.1 hypothetical protein [Paenibacillus chibensis]